LSRTEQRLDGCDSHQILLAGDLSGDVLEDTVPEQSDPRCAQVAELPVSLRLGHLTAMYCLVEERQHLCALAAAPFAALARSGSAEHDPF
jgi:hypothetical protein